MCFGQGVPNSWRHCSERSTRKKKADVKESCGSNATVSRNNVHTPFGASASTNYVNSKRTDFFLKCRHDSNENELYRPNLYDCDYSASVVQRQSIVDRVSSMLASRTVNLRRKAWLVRFLRTAGNQQEA